MQLRKRDRGGPGGGGGENSNRGKETDTSTTTGNTSSHFTTVTATTTETALLTAITTITSDNAGTGPTSIGGKGNPPTPTSNPNNNLQQATPPPVQPPSQTLTQTFSLPNSQPPSTLPSPSLPASRPIFLFVDPANTTVCSADVLSWTYNGKIAAPMTLFVQPQSGTPARILTTNVLSTVDTFTWLSVDVKEGWYIAKAVDTSATLGISAESTPFFVIQGSDTTCLLNTTASTTTSPIISSPSQTPSLIPSNPTGSKSTIGTGDIVGITLGIIAGLICLLLAAFTFPRLKRPEYFTSATKPMRQTTDSKSAIVRI